MKKLLKSTDSVGWEFNSAGISIAKYWKNGVPISLTDGSYHADAMAVVLR